MKGKAMKTTKHGQERLQQRGRNLLDALVIRKYGESHNRKPGIYILSRQRARQELFRLRKWLKRNKDNLSLSRRVADVREIIRRMEKTINWIALFSEGGELITIYLADKRRQRKAIRGNCRSLQSL